MSKAQVVGALKLGAVAVAFHFGGGLAGGLLAAVFAKLEVDRLRSHKLANDQQAIQENNADSEQGLPIVYGQTRVGVSIVDIRVSPSDSDILAVTGAIAVASESGDGIEDVLDVYFDDVLAFDAPSSSASSNPDFTRTTATWRTASGTTFGTDVWAGYGLHLGEDSQAVDPYLTTVFGTTVWPSTMTGRGVAYIATWLYKDSAKFSNGAPRITADVKGMKVKNVQSLGSTAAWSDNPADCVYDFLTSSRYGMAVPAAQIAADSFSTASIYCNATVEPYSGATLQKRFRCNGWLDSSASPLENLEKLLSSCAGSLIWENGKFKLLVKNASVSTSSYELTPSSIVGDMSFVRTGIESPNRVKATFIDADRGYQPHTVSWPEPGATNDYLTEDDGYRVEQAIDLPMCTDHYQAEYTASQLMLEARADIGCALTAERGALALTCGDLVKCTHDTPSFDEKLFWVDEVGLRRDGLVHLLLTEYNSAAYSVSGITEKVAASSASMPLVYARGVTTGVQVLNIQKQVKRGVSGSAFSRQVILQIDFSSGLGSFKVTVDPADASAHNYTINHSTATYTDELMQSNGTTPFEFGATISGGDTATTYPQSPCDVTITPYSEASLAGTAGDAVTFTIELDEDVGGVGVQVQATNQSNVVIPGNKILFPATGGLLAGVGTNNDPTVSLNISGVATGTPASSGGTDYLIYYDHDAGALRKVAVTGLPYEPEA